MAVTARNTDRHPSPADAGDALLDLQRRYLEAWGDAGQIMIDAARTMARRQVELAEEGLREFWAEAAEASRSEPDDRQPTDQLQRAQDLYRRALDGFQELSGIMLKAQSEAVRALVEGAASGADATRKAA